MYIVETNGTMSDHYDSSRKTIKLSSEVFHGDSIASISIAAHECGHAIQDKEGYAFMRIRSLIFPIVKFGTQQMLSCISFMYLFYARNQFKGPFGWSQQKYLIVIPVISRT